MKIFVFNSDDYVESVICERIFDSKEHILLGTSFDDKTQPSYLTTLVKNEPQHIKSALLDADVIIYRIQNSIDDAKYAIKVLESSTYSHVKTFILISNSMSWANTKKKYEEDEEEEEGEPKEEKIKQYEPFTEDAFVTRKPHPKYKQNIEIEKRVKKATCKTLKTYILFTGIFYGCGEDLLHPWFKHAWSCTEKPLPILLKGNNYIPMIHVSDLAEIVFQIIQSPPEEQSYIFAVDEAHSTLKEIIQAIGNEFMNPKTENLSLEESVMFDNYDIFTQDVKMQQGLVGEDTLPIEWKYKEGFIHHIKTIRKEFEKKRNLSPLKILVLGKPASGKSTISKHLEEMYDIPHIDIGSVIKEFKAHIDELKAELQKLEEEKLQAKKLIEARKSEEEEEQEEQEEEEEEDENSPINQLKNKIAKLEAIKPESKTQRYSDENLTKMVRWKLNQRRCRNHGWILDGYPKTVNQSKLLFLSPDEKGDDEEEEEEDEEGEQKAIQKYFPTYAVLLDVAEDLLEQRLMKLSDEEVANTHNTQEGFRRRLALYNQNNTEESNVIGHVEELVSEEDEQVITKEIKIEGKDVPVNDILKELQNFIGEAHNYGPTFAEREEIALQNKQKEQARKYQLNISRSKLHEQRDFEAHDRKIKREEERLQEILAQEKEMLRIKSEPLKQYLMENVIPPLTQGLIEVCKVRPEDPCDYLAEWLVKYANNEKK